MTSPSSFPRRAAVTGATGFVGRHLVRRLRAEGIEVAALVRSPLPDGEGDGVRQVRGSLEDAGSLERAFAGCDVVFHLGGRVTEWGPRELFRAVNVEGTRNVLEAAGRAGAGRVVFASSATVYGFHQRHTGTREDAPYARTITEGYTWSKIEAERLCFAAAERGADVAVARLGWLWGPGDTTSLPRLLDFLSAPVVFSVGSGRNVVDLAYVENVADALLLMARHPAARGEAFNVNDGERRTCREYLEALTAALGVGKAPRLAVPRAPVYAAATVLEAAARALRRPEPPPLTRYAIDAVFGTLDFPADKLFDRLGWRPPVGFDEGLARTAAWWKREGAALRAGRGAEGAGR